MRYTPNKSDDDKPQQMMVEGYAIPEHPYSDHTQFLKYTNEFDIEREPKEFKERYRNYIRVINKYPGMSNIDALDEVRIDLLWKDLALSELHGMMERAQKISLKLDHIYARSRGREGFGTKWQVTERHEILQEEKSREDKKKTLMEKVRGKPKQEVMVYADQKQSEE